MLRLLLGTIWLRPYVFVFLLIYLLLAVPQWGWRRTALYTVLGYALAWLAEYSSIHNGFPFGLYHYISEPTRGRELWLAGVPFMDSLSFVFLSFASLQTARLLLQAVAAKDCSLWDLRWAGEATISWREWLLAGLLTMGLDVVIDPVTLQGAHWFLGKIYYYPIQGPYFGVPVSNFAGWLLLALTIVGFFALLENHYLRRRLGGWRSCRYSAIAGAVLFTGILAFNLAVTFIIGEVAMGLTGCFWALLMLLPVGRRWWHIVRAESPAPETPPTTRDS